MSKDKLVTASHTPGSSRSITRSMATKKFMTLAWVSITPFGRPVEPDV
jgi:hypothetical protein